MQLKMDGKRRVLLSLALAASAVLYLGLAMRNFAAETLGAVENPAAWQRAAALDPGNALYPYQLGRYAMLSDRDAESAARYFEHAVAQNPHEARYWFELAQAYQVLDRPADQSRAFDHALAADPRTPAMAWQAGNFYLLQGDGDKALNAFRVVMENDPSRRADAIDMAWHVTPDVNRLLNQAIPPQAEFYLDLLRTLVVRKQDDPARQLWARLLQLGQPFEAKKGFFYIRYLLSLGEGGEARLAWARMAPLCDLAQYVPVDNLVVNGGFDLPLLNDGLDWHFAKPEHATLTLDDSAFHGGHNSLTVDFDGLGVSEVGLEQWVTVQPDTIYDFSAYFKAQAIEGAGGPVFLVQDQKTAVIYYTSAELKGSDIWREVNGSFRTGKDTSILSVRLVRIPPGNAIKGKLWVDDVQIVQHGESQTGKSKKLMIPGGVTP